MSNVLRSFLLLLKTASLFSLFSLSWGRQEDNFGQIHQLRQQQQQKRAAYAWPHSQRAFSLSGWLGWTPPITWRGLFARIYRVWRMWRHVLSSILCSQLAIRYWNSSKEYLEWSYLDSSELSPSWISHVISSKNYSGSLIKINFMKNSATCIYHGWAYEPSRPVLLIDRKT